MGPNGKIFLEAFKTLSDPISRTNYDQRRQSELENTNDDDDEKQNK